MPKLAMKIKKLMFGSLFEDFPVSDLKLFMHVKSLKIVVLDSDRPVDILTLSAEQFPFFNFPTFEVAHRMHVDTLPDAALSILTLRLQGVGMLLSSRYCISEPGDGISNRAHCNFVRDFA